MSTLPVTPRKEVELPIEEIDFDHIWVLYFRKGTVLGFEQKFFYLKGSLREAIDRGRLHCENITARFIRVDPFLRDLVEDELRHRERD